MNLYIDNQIVKILVQDPARVTENPLFAAADAHIHFKWPALLEYLGLGSLFSSLPPFDETQPLFRACIETLSANAEKEVIYYVYDRFFAEMLNQINVLSEINHIQLLQKLKDQRSKSSSSVQQVLSDTLNAYETALIERPSETMHDLILYLAWDRLCASLAILFDYQTNNLIYIQGLAYLKECLLESYQHITEQGRTSPSLYRMIEAFFYYQMREENLQKHSKADWSLLSQSFPSLMGQNELNDCLYIDNAVISTAKPNHVENVQECYATLDSPEKVQIRQRLSHYMLDQLKKEVPNWPYSLRQEKIVFLDL